MNSHFVSAASGHFVIGDQSSSEVPVEFHPITINFVSDCVIDRMQECVIFVQGEFIVCQHLLVMIGHHTCTLLSCEPNAFQCVLSDPIIGEYSFIAYSSMVSIYQSVVNVRSHIEFQLSASNVVAGNMMIFMILSNTSIPKFCIFRSTPNLELNICVPVKYSNGCVVPSELEGSFFVELSINCHRRKPSFEQPVRITGMPRISSVYVDSYPSVGSLTVELSDVFPAHASVSSCQLGDIFSYRLFFNGTTVFCFFPDMLPGNFTFYIKADNMVMAYSELVHVQGAAVVFGVSPLKSVPHSHALFNFLWLRIFEMFAHAVCHRWISSSSFRPERFSVVP